MAKFSEDDQTQLALYALAGIVILTIGAGVPGGLTTATLGSAIIVGRRKMKGINRHFWEAIPEGARLFIPALLLAYRQMSSDLERSSLIPDAKYSVSPEEIKEKLDILNPKEILTADEREFRRIFEKSVWGVASDADISILSEMDQTDIPLRIDCSAVNVGAYVALISMKKRYGASFAVDPSAASGRETVVTEGYKGDDLVITADAPMILGEETIRFKKLLNISTEIQSVLIRKGTSHKDKRKVFLYPRSSVDYQQRVISSEGNNATFKFPSSIKEVQINDLSQYVQLDRE
ncbi:MAG: hypothetical protein AAFQ24_12795, partial [Pseudomonadota bacterium]